MSAKSQSDKIIFGLKVKQLRQEQKLSFAELSQQSGLSVSYLNEIEKGKKYPKEDKIYILADALGTAYEELISSELNKSLAPVADLLQSNFLNELPLDLFGIDLNKIVEIIANAPVRVSAFISTLLELSRNYALKEENFYFSALRAFLELHNNYFESIETAVSRFCILYDLPETRPVPVHLLRHLLEDRFNYEIEDTGLDPYPELKDLRSVYLPNKQKLLLNGELSSTQQSFQFGKELGFQFLELKERANTSSILKSMVFEQVLNHSKAIYFSVALHIPQRAILEDMSQFFSSTRWSGEHFLQIMEKYAATPEMFFHRLTNILPTFFGMKKLFFLRFLHYPQENTFEIDRELHLSHKHPPHGNGLFEHYCRRWIAISLLEEIPQHQEQGNVSNTIVGVQRSKYYDTEDEYLCFTLARPAYPKPNTNVSATLGILITEELRQKVLFLDDSTIRSRIVSNTCERCAVKDCAERAANPIINDKKEEWNRIQERLKDLSGQ